jgi:16S rRNA (uracil1498-N3)-methyltransferase
VDNCLLLFYFKKKLKIIGFLFYLQCLIDTRRVQVMRLHRFYIYKPLGEEIVVENAGEEKEYNRKLLHQWTTVFRYTSGDEVILFSPFSPGKDFTYRLSSISKQASTLAPVSTSENILSTYPLTLVMAVVKKDTFETIVRQATELGVTRIIPVLAARSEKKNLNFERLEAISIEASEQSGRGIPPLISQIMTFEEALQETSSSFQILGSLHGAPLTAIEKASISPQTGITLWVGPEGGWTTEEEQMTLTRGMFSFKLTDTVLKADTAATALLSALLTQDWA